MRRVDGNERRALATTAKDVLLSALVWGLAGATTGGGLCLLMHFPGHFAENLALYSTPVAACSVVGVLSAWIGGKKASLGGLLGIAVGLGLLALFLAVGLVLLERSV